MDERLLVSFECRDIRHSWQRDGDTILLSSTRMVREFTRTLVCERCGTARIDHYRMTAKSLVRERSRYQYVTDYQHPGGRYPLESARIERFSQELARTEKGDSAEGDGSQSVVA